MGSSPTGEPEVEPKIEATGVPLLKTLTPQGTTRKGHRDHACRANTTICSEPSVPQMIEEVVEVPKIVSQDTI